MYNLCLHYVDTASTISSGIEPDVQLSTTFMLMLNYLLGV
jgi:hypothetical protein